ncbi:dynein light chain LC6, flagellar outer arm-like isoform X2 [Cucurbita moschata]|uniref:Dynein light chain n=1 Tax=Cucurbita moschata TaxID=3662 RepID=A0A6J1GP16_CUCMO|nr:dynein light chain LC6, flagellar outer arm-like isoform X2 [Cucurbita moschata]
MLEGKALVQDTDMPGKMQIQAMDAASQALDRYDVFDCKSIAAHIKKDFDDRYGSGWQCVVGSNFGCFFTHSKGSFIFKGRFREFEYHCGLFGCLMFKIL